MNNSPSQHGFITHSRAGTTDTEYAMSYLLNDRDENYAVDMPWMAQHEESYGGLIGMLESVHDVMRDEAESLIDQLSCHE